jgi:hypothetical protein
MRHLISRSAVLIVCTLLSACATSPEPDEVMAERIVSRMVRQNNVAVAILGPQQIEADARGGATIPDILARRVSTLRVMRGTGRMGSCARFVLRGIKSITGPPDPEIYIDGARTADSCVLDGLPSSNVAMIEVYSAGQMPRSASINPGLGGVILITTKH